MKRNSQIKRTASGQLIILFLLIISILALLIFSFHDSSNEKSEVKAANAEFRKKEADKKVFPYNRYSNEVLIY